MQEDWTDVVILLDRSGSMTSIKTDMEGVLSTFLKEQRKLPGKLTITLYQFDDIFETVFVERDVNMIDNIVITPRNSTALIDALSTSLETTKTRIKSIPKDKRPAKKIFWVITDGQENASHKTTRTQVFQEITKMREKHQIQFIFMGANQDAIKEGLSYGIYKGSAYKHGK